jgi:hypothetical protein
MRIGVNTDTVQNSTGLITLKDKQESNLRCLLLAYYIMT